ncbi:MAG: AsmA family protein [Phycisphaerales bacterium]|nr:AsmA family protein [Phycisphaerales bacterium]
MKKIILILLSIVVVIVLAIAGVILFVLSQIDTLAKKGIEEGGTYALAVPVTVEKVDIGLMKGTFDMTGFKVANPQGFSAPHFFALGDTGVAVSYDSLQSDIIELPTLRLTDISVHLQKQGDKANYQVILDNLKRFDSGEKPASEPKPEGASKKLIVRNIEIRNVRASVELLPLGGEASTVNVAVPEILLTDVGSDGSGVEFGELVKIITQAVLESIALNGQLPEAILGELTAGLADLGSLSDLGVNMAVDAGEGLKNVVGDVGAQAAGAIGGVSKEAGEAVEKAADEAGKAIDDATKKIDDGIKGLLPGKKKEGGN